MLAAGDRPYDLVLADLDGAGRSDLAVIAYGSARLTIVTEPGA